MASCLLVFIVVFTMVFQSIATKTIPRIGIVGGGIGGTSSAYFLTKMFNNQASIVLFERGDVGGRLNLIDMNGNYYESGGSVIHPDNRYMAKFVKLLGLEQRKPSSGVFGIFDGEKFVFEESSWSVVTLIRLLSRYGFSLFNLRQITKSMLYDFNSIYNAQAAGRAYTSVSGLLEFLNTDFVNMTQDTFLLHLKKEGIPDIIIKELAQSIMMVNYGQTNDISGFAGFVSLAGAEPGLWSIKGGNKMVPQKLLKLSDAIVVRANVVDVTQRDDDDTFDIRYNDTASGGRLKDLNFDIVVIAVPLIRGKSNIEFINFKEDFSSFQREYHRTVATFVKGDLKTSAFNSRSVLDEILTFNENLFFNSIGKVSPVDDSAETGKTVYKIFSQRPLHKKEIDALFNNVELVKSVDWLAYPHYIPPEELSPFIMSPGLYYLNAIESAASAMEMSVISARNIALLVSSVWNSTMDLVDSDQPVYRDEL